MSYCNMEKKYFIVYLIHREDNQKYIGSSNTARIDKRMYDHKRTPRFQNFSFTYEILYMTDNYDHCLDVEEILIAEYDTYHNGLNDTPNGRGNHRSKNFTTLGYVFSESSRKKMSESAKKRPRKRGYKMTPCSEELKRKRSENSKGENSSTAKLTEKDVIEILRLYQSRPDLSDKYPIGKIMRNGRSYTYEHAFSNEYADRYGICNNNVRNIITRKNWAHVEI